MNASTSVPTDENGFALYRTHQTLNVNPLDKSGSHGLVGQSLLEPQHSAAGHIAEMTRLYGQPYVTEFTGPGANTVEKFVWVADTPANRFTDVYWVQH